MQKNTITEIARFSIIDTLLEEEFISVATQLEVEFHSKQPGYIDSELLKGKEPQEWLILMHWESMEHAKAASKAMMQTPQSEQFRSLLIPSTVKLEFLEQIGTWKKI